MTQEEIDSLKVEDCFMSASYSICKVMEVGAYHMVVCVVTVGKTTFYMDRPKINSVFIRKSDEKLKTAILVNRGTYDKVYKVLEMALTTARNIASSSVITEKKD